MNHFYLAYTRFLPLPMQQAFLGYPLPELASIAADRSCPKHESPGISYRPFRHHLAQRCRNFADCQQ